MCIELYMQYTLKSFITLVKYKTKLVAVRRGKNYLNYLNVSYQHGIDDFVDYFWNKKPIYLIKLLVVLKSLRTLFVYIKFLVGL